MGIIINPRGPAGAGKSELVRRAIGAYKTAGVGSAESIYIAGRRQPICYRLRHPDGGRPLIVLGHYERTAGGCDTFRREDGGLDEVFRLASAYAGDGHDVLFEARAISREYARTQTLAQRHRLHVLYLNTPASRCARNLLLRRRRSAAEAPALAANLAAEAAAIEGACERLSSFARIAASGPEEALVEALRLLGVAGAQPAGCRPRQPQASAACGSRIWPGPEPWAAPTPRSTAPSSASTGRSADG
jgi:hypothetical protein